MLPAHNEAENLGSALAALIPALEADAATADYEILVVDDCSSDGTRAVANEAAARSPRIRVLQRDGEAGFGDAVKDGLRAAQGEAVVPFMSDLSDNPREIPRMRAKLDEGFDVVHGSRFVPGGHAQAYPRGKMAANRVFNFAVRLLFGVPYRDVSNAFKMYRREVIEAVGVDRLESRHFDLTIELPLKAHILGFRSAEVPATWTGRARGEAKFRVGRMGHRYGRRLLKLFFLGNLVALGELFRDLYRGPKWRVAVGALLGLLLLAGFVSLAGGAGILSRLSEASLPLLGVAASLVLVALLLRVWRSSVLLRSAEHRVSRETAFRCLMFGWLVNYLLPARLGDLARGTALRASGGVPLGAGLTTIGVERLLDMAVLSTFVLAGAFLYGGGAEASMGDLQAWSLAALAFLGLILILVAAYEDALAGRLPRLHAFLRSARDGVRSVASNRTALALSVLLSLLVWTAEVATVYFSALALGVRLPPDEVALVGAAAFLAQALPSAPAALGLHEGAVAGVLAVFGVPAATGLAVGLADHAARAVVVYLFGTVATVHLGFQTRAHFRSARLARERARLGPVPAND